MLTPTDLHNIKHLFDDRFDSIDARFDGIDDRLDRHDAHFSSIDSQLIDIRGDIDALSLATAAGFADVDRRFADMDGRFDDMHEDFAEVKEDVAVIKDVVKDHSFRITRLEHYIRPAD